MERKYPSCPRSTSPGIVSGPSPKDLLKRRLELVEQRISDACRRAGRRREDVSLVAVTKSASTELAGLLVELGALHLGESRPQELWRKRAALPDTVHWHFVGHLQRNKIERTLPVHLIHSVDRMPLLTALDREATRRGMDVDVLLEVNASRERTKMGFAPEDLDGAVPEIAKLERVRVRGLMTLAAPSDDAERCRPTFVLLRKMRDELRGRLGPAHSLDQLSMGMSDDFEVAIEEGATLVRLGTILVEGLGEAAQ
jgi:pyridoxal phosphate enzyme (YggS family)